MLHTPKVFNYIESLPELECTMASMIRETIISIVPEVEERFSFKIPFYHFFGMFCYINYLKNTGGIELAFCRGKDLVLAFPELQTSGRAMVAGLCFFKPEEVNHPIVKNVLEAAAAWQKEAWAEKRRFVKSSKSK
jgi:hypothetical protein